MAYDRESLDNAIANSVDPRWWVANGPQEGCGFIRSTALREAALTRWVCQQREDGDSAIIREALHDLNTLGYFNYEEDE